MNATQLAQNAYGSGTRSVRTPRGIEYEAFARVTSRLKAVASQLQQSKRAPHKTKSQASFRVSGHYGKLAEALDENRRLWTLLASDVASSNNQLPDDLRARILFLAEFTRQHTAKVLKQEASVVPLLEINLAIMRGLGNQPSNPKAKAS